MSEMISTAKVLLDSSKRLADAGHDEARLEAEVLLAHALQSSRASLYATLSVPLNSSQLETFQALVERHLAGEPVAYIVGKREFYGLELRVDPRALIPRPETEQLVQKAAQVASRISHLPLTIADVGTGSGAVAISLAYALPSARIYATDLSCAAIELASTNCKMHGLLDRIELLTGDLLDPVPEPVAIVVANLPYVASHALAQLPPEIRCFEPRSALDGGEDGLQVYRRLLQQIPEKTLPGGYALMEIGDGQGPAMVDAITDAIPGASVMIEKDYAGLDRIVTIELVAESQR